MPSLFVALMFASALATASGDVFDRPVSCSHYIATFQKTHFGARKYDVGARLTVLDQQRRELFDGELSIDVRSAQWTPDAHYLVITGINSAGHSPWHFFVEIFSVAAHQIREIDPNVDPFIVSSNLSFEPPNTVNLIGHTFAHGISAPDDPVPIRLNLDKAWPKLKKT